MEKNKKSNLDKENLDNKESFLKRWSNRKSLTKNEDDINDVSTDNEINDINDTQIEEEKSLTDDELAKKYEISNPESINNSVDLREMLNKNIPDRLKQLALRRLWRIVPGYGEISELVEYGEDFTDAATVIDNLQTAYVVGKGYLDKVVEKGEDLLEKSDEAIDQIENKNLKKSTKISKIKNSKKEYDRDAQISKIKDEKLEQNDMETLPAQENTKVSSEDPSMPKESLAQKHNQLKSQIKPKKMVFKKS